MADELSDDDLQTVYCWVDSIQLSRPKRNISRDFADGGKFDPPDAFAFFKNPIQTTAIFFGCGSTTTESLTYLFASLASFSIDLILSPA